MAESIPIAATPPARLDAGCRRRHERPIRARAIKIGADADRSENLSRRVKGNLRFPLTSTYHGCPRNSPHQSLNVTAEEKEKLTLLGRRPKSSQAAAMRARIVPGCDEGLSNTAVANKLHITGTAVCKWRERFRSAAAERSAGPAAWDTAHDRRWASRGGGHANAGIDARQQHPLEYAADGAEDGLSQTAIVRIWRALGLQPHRRGSYTAVAQLETAMLDYLRQRNRNPKPFLWTADADLILGKIQRLSKRISDSGNWNLESI